MTTVSLKSLGYFWKNDPNLTSDLQKQPLEVFRKKMFLEISQNAQENTCAQVSKVARLIKLLASDSDTIVFL